MFKKMRLRFIAIASVAVLVVLMSTVGVLNFAQSWETGYETTLLLQVINNNDGEIPASGISGFFGTTITSADLQHYQFFSVLKKSNGTITITNKTNINYLTDAQVKSAARQIFNNDFPSSTVIINNQNFSYLKSQKSNGVRLTAMNINSNVETRNSLYRLSLMMVAGGLLFFVVIAAILSRWAVRPYVENYEKQKRFITNAGHELKTPLAIISANNELQEMMEGSSEWTESTKVQVERMTALINQMVALARLEEQPNIKFETLDFSQIVRNAATSFKAPIMRDNKHFEIAIDEGVSIKAEPKSAFELVNILVDNANKYCDPEGTVTVLLRKSRDLRYSAHLEVSNTYKEGKNANFAKFFERFYREDSSHTSANGNSNGFGIGLSMAQNMVKLFKGKIDVHYKDETITFIVRI